MAVGDVTVPSIGPTPRVFLSRWLVADGATVTVDQPLCDLETDKASVDLPALQAGTIRLLVPEGSYVELGALIAVVTPHP